MLHRWAGCETVVPISFKHLILPERDPAHTDLLDLAPLPITALQNRAFETLFSGYSHFNPIQTQLFHVLYHTDASVLLGAPTGSGKTAVAEIAVLRMVAESRK
jgi:superfamily II DNA/RNA helicase